MPDDPRSRPTITTRPFGQGVLRVGPLLFAAMLQTLAVHASAQAPPATHLVQVTVLLAGQGPASTPTDLPANVMSAVEDISQFLPYAQYTTLDTALIRVSQAGETTMRGHREGAYTMRFVLENKGAEQIYVHTFRATYQPPLPGPGSDVKVERPRTLLSTSFSTEVGKTVVVGSSRLDGGEEALVFLFTVLAS